jgi:hypothetical protein
VVLVLNTIGSAKVSQCFFNGGLPDEMGVEVDPGIGMSARTVGKLRKVTAWPENLAITTPQERFPGSAIRVLHVREITEHRAV